MKVVFVGPTLASRSLAEVRQDIVFKPPAAFGDIALAVIGGASAIGLIDGLFEDRAAVWHKEILFALSEGVRVYGAASMGALRAAECARFGMIGIGEVFRRLMAGELIDDDAVAQVHAPAELGYAALSEPLVNVEATCKRLLGSGLATLPETHAIMEATRRCFFKERTIAGAVDGAEGLTDGRRGELLDLMLRYRRDIKAEDALDLIGALDAVPDERTSGPTDWCFAETQIWRRLLDDVRARAVASITRRTAGAVT